MAGGQELPQSCLLAVGAGLVSSSECHSTKPPSQLLSFNLRREAASSPFPASCWDRKAASSPEKRRVTTQSELLSLVPGWVAPSSDKRREPQTEGALVPLRSGVEGRSPAGPLRSRQGFVLSHWNSTGGAGSRNVWALPTAVSGWVARASF